MLGIVAVVVSGGLVPYDLRADELTSPLVLASERPNLSWKLRAGDKQSKDKRQTAFRIIVASTKANAMRRLGDLWDTGKEASNKTFGIPYGGTLSGGRQAYWRVQVWDEADRSSDWSEVATFAAGSKLGTKEAKWICGETPKPVVDPFEGASWVWKPGAVPGDQAKESVTFWKEFDAKGGSTGTVTLTADNTFVLRLNGSELARTTDPEGWRRPVTVGLGANLKYGKNRLEVEVTNATRSPAGLIAVVVVDGKKSTTDASWSVGQAKCAVLGGYGAQPWGKVADGQIVRAPAQSFLKAFRAKDRPVRAVAYVSALGIVDLTVNGKRASENLFTPGWSDYRKRVYEHGFDVTPLMHKGENSIGAELGQGWYAGYVAWGMQREHYGATPAVRVRLVLEHSDGSQEVIVSDGSWRTSEGPVRDEHFLHGETYDARITAAHDRTARLADVKVPVEPFPGVPVQEYAVVKPKSVKEAEPGVWLIDFGQNLAGYVRLSIDAEAGDEVVFRHAERLGPDGRIYTANLRAAKATDTYIARGGGRETWNPRFTFHGFQYVEVRGLRKKPTAREIVAVAISSATPEVGWLETSDPMLNRLVTNAWWTQKMNFIDVPTDCPQRDERLGWTGDAQAYVRTATYFSDVQTFFRKWLVALDDGQGSDGNYPKVAPVISGLGDGGPAWGDAGVICPDTVWKVYGDDAIVADRLSNLKKFVDFCEQRSKPSLLPPDQYHCYGDWLSINANTPNEVITTAYFAGSARLVAQMADALGRTEDARRYSELADRVGRAFVDAYVTQDGKVKGETQCGYVLALGFGLLDDRLAGIAATRLVADIERRGWHLSTGFVGTRDLLHVLVKIGRQDVAFRLLHNTTFPSWGFTVKNGATSIWERWDGWTPDKGFQDPGMNSFAHYAYGAVAGWMFENIGGLREAKRGYEEVWIAPRFDPGLSWAKCRYESVRGLVTTEWRRRGGSVQVEVGVPPNVKARVALPGQPERLVGSGTWSFTVAD